MDDEHGDGGDGRTGDDNDRRPTCGAPDCDEPLEGATAFQRYCSAECMNVGIEASWETVKDALESGNIEDLEEPTEQEVARIRNRNKEAREKIDRQIDRARPDGGDGGGGDASGGDAGAGQPDTEIPLSLAQRLDEEGIGGSTAGAVRHLLAEHREAESAAEAAERSDFGSSGHSTDGGNDEKALDASGGARVDLDGGGFDTLLELCMAYDEGAFDDLRRVADREAGSRGYKGWVEAYHRRLWNQGDTSVSDTGDEDSAAAGGGHSAALSPDDIPEPGRGGDADETGDANAGKASSDTVRFVDDKSEYRYDAALGPGGTLPHRPVDCSGPLPGAADRAVFAEDGDGGLLGSLVATDHRGRDIPVGHPEARTAEDLARAVCEAAGVESVSRPDVLMVDFDNTITRGDVAYWEGEAPEPDEGVCEAVRQRYYDGWAVVVWTARPWSEASSVAARLTEWGVPYHGVRCEKGSASEYVDDKATTPGEFADSEGEQR